MKVQVVVHTNSKNPRVEKRGSEELHVYVAQSPIEGKANEAVKKALAAYFKKPKSSLVLLRGQTSKQKIFDIK